MKIISTLLIFACFTAVGFAPKADGAALSAANQSIYLPLVIKAGETGSSAIVNGDFEAGRSGWIEYEDSAFFDFVLIVQKKDLPSGITPYDGDWVAWLGGDSELITYIEQEISIPAPDAELVYWHWVDSIDGCDASYGGVYLNDVLVDQHPLCVSSATGGWVMRTVDLSAYAGQVAMLRFWSQTVIENYSNWFIDAVSVHSLP